ncbi:NAD(P)/FAD-dependent oxidoreductase [Fructilactobacillus fructivorans]|uniref:NADH dehydrogenase n=1 Tax=Fructilactobacillus fructivorans TaxID=1614 RepID=A0A0C1PNP1_9LACO|nr:NAD(P)/FAD-dependent oxidoreductase [Fructilactobacillus fructivorans]KID42357.1 NADH dehydrogenase [Fructilactobacillus fructivorans]MCT0151026.1 NAD(P)/FAD-dependent oxidoreductase [Fructilactobacillus fructivorans]MCT2867416.1 NAD(P)/FAD-dependent oxidoreductase [Fructilactobacillus fructivorans]MCT2869065.1 NAD(P)/FAD-dependent oxidoreductase [Fructilactobacillus fructivorans]MCT2873215.1 NAD(P)/FAD-dependent oxidoreductase [Fructilactobacillus fructivorans]
MKKVLILGGGFAGLRACKLLAKSKADLDITLVNKNAYHYDSTGLYKVASGDEAPERLMFRITDMISPKVHFIEDDVVKVNGKDNTVSTKKNGDLSYDYLFNALGFEPETFGTPGADEFGLQISDIDNSAADYQKIQTTLDEYDEFKDPKLLNIVVVGGGFTGIELLGDLVHMVPKWAKKYGFKKEDFKITCIAPGFLPMFNKKLGDYAQHFLEKKGVKFVMGDTVSKITADGAYYGKDDKFIPSHLVFWTAGVKGSDVIPASQYPDEHRNRVAVNTDMSLNDFPNQYLIGDVSAVKDDKTGRMFPTTGQISIYEADVAVNDFLNKLNGKSAVKFDYKSMGTVCSLGPYSGIAEIYMFGMTFKLKGCIVPIFKNMIFKKNGLELGNIRTMLES